jgi:hypothetical protein
MVTGVLAELTRLIPDEAYISQVQINEDEVRIDGFALSVAELVVALNRSSLFSKVEFLSPITVGPDNERNSTHNCGWTTSLFHGHAYSPLNPLWLWQRAAIR